MEEGNSATIKVAFDKTSDKDYVIKAFKALTGEGFCTLPDYKNEIAVLEILSKYKDHLSFEVPTIINHNVCKERINANDPIAFIEMTRLSGSLAKIDIKAVEERIRHAHIREAAIALVSLHNLPLREEDKKGLTRDPLTYNNEWLKTHKTGPAAEVKKLHQALSNMQEPMTFIHNDFHHNNLFADHYGGPITGVCDFCCSGIGPKEMDFYPYLSDKKTENIFIESYLNAGGMPLQQDNLNTVRALSEYIRTYSGSNVAKPLLVQN